MKERFFLSILMTVIFVIAISSLSFAVTLVGERVVFEPPNPMPGQEVTPVVHFSVQGGPVYLGISYTIRGTPAAHTPTLSFNAITGSNTLRLPSFRIPDPAPYEICFDISYFIVGANPARTGRLVSNACLKRNLRVASTGRGERRELPDLPVADSLPDLTVVRGEISHYPSQYAPGGHANMHISIANLGGTTAENVPWKAIINYILCWYVDWSPGTLDTFGLGKSAVKYGRIPRIAPGETVTVTAKFTEHVIETYDPWGRAHQKEWRYCEIFAARIDVDSPNRIRELNEGNNTFIFPWSRNPMWE